METTDILTTLLGGSLLANIAQIVLLRSAKKKAMAEAQSITDEVLLKRIDFLDSRITELEKKACFKSDCTQRI